jgi:transcriptional regulator with XRE-family HTH domain
MLRDVVNRLREERGWSIIDLAEAAGIGRGTAHSLCNHSRYSPKLETLERVARALGVDVATLVQEEGDDATTDG